MLAKKDMRALTQFAREIIKFLSENFWKEGVFSYFDGVEADTK